MDIPFFSSSWALGSSDTHWASSEQSIIHNEPPFVKLQECEGSAFFIWSVLRSSETRQERPRSFYRGGSFRMYNRRKSPQQS